MPARRRHREAAALNAPRLTHVRVLVSDFSASHRFYGEVLGLPTEWPDNGSYAEFETGGAVRLAIFPRAEMAGDVELEPTGDGVVLVLDVGDVDSAHAALLARGAAFVDEPHDRPEWGLRIVHLRDPDGHLVELFHDIAWEA